MKERWKQIPGFPGREVSNLGRVRRMDSLKRPIYYRTYQDAYGHVKLQIRYQNTPNSLRLARLVGAAFCPSFKPELRQVYKDGDKTNCAASNLKWVSQSKVTGSPYSRNPKRSALVA